MDSGVRQAHIEVAPALKGDRRVKKHKLAVFRLQQYSQILQVSNSVVISATKEMLRAHLGNSITFQNLPVCLAHQRSIKLSLGKCRLRVEL